MITEPMLGASEELINLAEAELNVKFPTDIRGVWLVSNGLELPGGWRFCPVFNPKDPRKTCNHIGYENTKGRWETMQKDLLAIATGDTGNKLVLHVTNGVAGSDILLWDHETAKTRRWGKDFAYLLKKAGDRAVKIAKAIARASRKRNHDFQRPLHQDAESSGP